LEIIFESNIFVYSINDPEILSDLCIFFRTNAGFVIPLVIPPRSFAWNQAALAERNGPALPADLPGCPPRRESRIQPVSDRAKHARIWRPSSAFAQIGFDH
jgi:hypothetical protein